MEQEEFNSRPVIPLEVAADSLFSANGYNLNALPNTKRKKFQKILNYKTVPGVFLPRLLRGKHDHRPDLKDLKMFATTSINEGKDMSLVTIARRSTWHRIRGQLFLAAWQWKPWQWWWSKLSNTTDAHFLKQHSFRWKPKTLWSTNVLSYSLPSWLAKALHSTLDPRWTQQWTAVFQRECKSVEVQFFSTSIAFIKTQLGNTIYLEYTSVPNPHNHTVYAPQPLHWTSEWPKEANNTRQGPR